MSKKLVSLVLALMMLATVALAESVPSKTTEGTVTVGEGTTVAEVAQEVKQEIVEKTAAVLQNPSETVKAAFAELLGDAGTPDFETAETVAVTNLTFPEEEQDQDSKVAVSFSSYDPEKSYVGAISVVSDDEEKETEMIPVEVVNGTDDVEFILTPEVKAQISGLDIGFNIMQVLQNEEPEETEE